LDLITQQPNVAQQVVVQLVRVVPSLQARDQALEGRQDCA
jgi:hypothetical protein